MLSRGWLLPGRLLLIRGCRGDLRSRREALLYPAGSIDAMGRLPRPPGAGRLRLPIVARSAILSEMTTPAILVVRT